MHGMLSAILFYHFCLLVPHAVRYIAVLYLYEYTYGQTFTTSDMGINLLILSPPPLPIPQFQGGSPYWGVKSTGW